MMTHEEYLGNLGRHFACQLVCREDSGEFSKAAENYRRELIILANLNLDPVIPVLGEIYSPTVRRPPKDPVCMLRSLILMTLRRESSVTKRVGETRSSSVPALLTGFDPDKTPGIGTYYDFFDRITDGPCRKPCDGDVPLSAALRGGHIRDFPAEKEAKKKAREDDPDPHRSKSEKLAEELLSQPEKPRPDDFRRILEDILLLAGVIPSAEAGLLSFPDDLAVSGDGSVLRTAASSVGKKKCDCRSEGIPGCDHPRFYTSSAAEWCHDAAHDRYVFGDRYYHLVVTQGGHDFPLLIVMPGGNESDFTLSLTAFGRLLRAARENGFDIGISCFTGDGHHDSYARYRYFAEKGVIPVIPLSGNSEKEGPGGSGDIRLASDGTPLCPGGKPMRHQGFDRRKNTHVFACPAKRGTHRDGKYIYVMHKRLFRMFFVSL